MAKKLSAWNKKVRQVAKSNPKLSFKQVIKKAKREYKGSGTTKKRSTKKVSKVKKVAKRRYRKKKKSRRRGLFNLRSMFSLIKVGSFIAPAITNYSAMSGTMANKAGRTLIRYGGIDSNGNFNMNILKNMWLPLVATTLVTTGVSKVSSLIRRI